MTNWRCVRILLIVLVVVVPTILGALAVSNLVSEAAAGPPWTIGTQVLGSGTVAAMPDQTSYDTGTLVQLTASPATGWHFVGWSGDASGSDDPLAIVMDSDKTVTANFAIDTFTLTYAAGPNGSVSGTTPQTVSYGGSGTPVTASATTTGYHFVNWSDGVTTATRTDSSVTANHSVTANFAVNQYTVTPSAGANGTISPATVQTVNYGATPTFTISAATGYHVLSVLVDSVSVGTIPAGTVTYRYTFPAVAANHTIAVSFAINTYTLTPTTGANGTISPATVQTVNYGATPTFTFTPTTGYHVSAVTVDGNPVTMTGTNAYTFSAVAANHTIAVSFAINTYTLTPTTGANGTISPATVQTVNYGATPIFTIKAAPDYYVADVLVDNVSVGPVTRYTFTPVGANHTISASFAVGVQTRLSISVAKTVVTYGSSTMLTGALYNSADPLHEVSMGAQPVTVQTSSSTAGPWVDLKTLTTSSLAGSVGTYSLTVTPTGATYYRLYFVAASDSGYGSVLSYFVRVSVRPVLGAPKVPLSVRAGRSFTVHGTLRPHWPAGQKTVAIKVYRHKNRRWVLTRQVPATNADSGGNTSYGVKVRLTAKGRYRFQAYTPSTMTWVGVTTQFSTVLTVR